MFRLLRVVCGGLLLSFFLLTSVRAQYHSLLVQTDGSLWAWGNNTHGQLGDGTTTDRETPIRVGPGTAWRSADAGQWHTLAIRPDGSLWAWGRNESGQLGDGTTSPRLLPVPIMPGTRWRSVSAGDAHTMAIRQDGTLWAWGANWNGGLGDGTTTSRLLPVPIQAGITWRSVSAGQHHTAAIRPDGTLWTWGNNSTGALGDGTRTNRLVPYKISNGAMQSVSAHSGYVIAIDQNGKLWNWGDPNPLGWVSPNLFPYEAQPESRWRSVSAGFQHCLLIKDDGTLWSAGSNRFGSLGIGPRANNRPNAVAPGTTWQAITAGFQHSMGIQADGSVWTWGYNYRGALGTPLIKTTRLTVPLPVAPAATWRSFSGGFSYSAAIDEQGRLWGWGEANALSNNQYNIYQPPTPLDEGTQWDKIYVGSSVIAYLMGIRVDGSLWTWGPTPGRYSGDSYNSALDTYKPVPIVPGSKWQSVAAGPQGAWGIRQDGTLWGWGGNRGGFYSVPILGDGTRLPRPEPVPIAADFRWQQVSTSLVDHYYSGVIGDGYYTAAIRQDSTLWVWGHNYRGQLGLGENAAGGLVPTQVRPGSKWLRVSIGDNHALALAKDSTLWAWGNNDYGQLGTGTTTRSSVPLPVASTRKWQAVAAGQGFSAALDANGRLWAWGINQGGAVGNGTGTDAATPQPVAAAGTWHSVQAGMAHVLALRPDKALWAWGSNSTGQAGQPFYSTEPLRIGSLGGPLAARLPVPATGSSLGLRAWPLPFGAAGVQVQLPGFEPGAAVLSLLDATGRLRGRRGVQVPAGPASLLVPEAGALPAGIYLLRVQQGARQATLRLPRE